jgi:hypothetical protein
MKLAAWICGAGALAVAVSMGCSSSSGGGGGATGCGDMSGSWTMSGSCPQNPTTCQVSQSDCTATLTCDTGTASAKVSGSTMTFIFNGASCSGSVSNGQFTGSCTEEGNSCPVSGSCSIGSCGKPPAGTGGAGGGSGGGTSGGGGTGAIGGTSGFGGTGATGGGGGGNCGDVLYSNNAVCQSCMESGCCSQLAACSTGTPCDALFNCIISYCSENLTSACLQQYCSSELASGGGAMSAMFDCEEAACAEQCASEG